ncbi:sonic hedgehog protein-like [Rhopilema esculentum]|uniref:sonic hedgehog protein-like n=1 Tax=Rhopilema esculentum TaxID=499914 RepID=UPI0031D1CD33|eukprot:gene2123-17709_t
MKVTRDRNCYFLMFLFCQILRVSLQCGPGPSASRRSKRLKPMTLYQRLPDVDEDSISGSGMFRRIVTDESKEYKELVKNYNKDIVFESGEGKRIMTKRCREKIDVLAKLVKHQWPNVKLRVIEAYDKYGQHPPNSLHYEARAVDITTSDRDKSKIGSLGALAYRAGFDWVYYESHSYIHASVVAENEVSLKQADCFPGSSKVETLQRGQVSLEDLRTGDDVLTFTILNDQYIQKYTKVLGFLDKVKEIRQKYYTFETSNGAKFAATKSHLVFKVKDEVQLNCTVYNNFGNQRQSSRPSQVTTSYFHKSLGIYRFLQFSESETLQFHQQPLIYDSAEQLNRKENTKFAGLLRIGESLLTKDQKAVRRDTIRVISQNIMQGAYAPLTEEGSLIVDGVWVSSYAKIRDPRKAHYAFAPFRTWCKFAPLCTWEELLNLYVDGLKWLNRILGIVDLY